MKLSPLLFCSVLAAQTPVERTLRFSESATAQELFTVVRSTVQLRESSVDLAQKTMWAKGTQEQIAMAEWLLPQLDGPGGGLNQHYRVSAEDLISVLRPKHLSTPQSLQELTTVLRSIAEIPQAFVYTGANAITLRATPDRIAVAEWVFDELESSTKDSHEMRTGDDVVRILYPQHAETIQSFQELSTCIRSIAEIRRAFTYNERKALVIWGKPAQMEMAQFLLAALDGGSSGERSQVPGGGDDVVRIFKASGTEFAGKVRPQVRRLGTYNTERAVAVRGTAAQISAAEQMAQ